MTASGTTLGACGLVFAVEFLPASAPPAFGPAIEVEFSGVRTRARMATVGERHWVDLAEFGAFSVVGSRPVIEVHRWPLRADARVEFLNGPALLCALAQQDIYALHASAFRLGADADAPVVAVIAASGTGKSTLAAAAQALGWERLSDDVLPVQRRPGSGLVGLPQFPQLKLDASQQYGDQRPVAVPLSALVDLRRGTQLQLSVGTARELSALVLASTIASRVYAPERLGAHLRFAGTLPALIEQRRLHCWRLQIEDNPGAPERSAHLALACLAAALKPAREFS